MTKYTYHGKPGKLVAGDESIDPCPGRTIERLEQENARLLTELQTVCCRKNVEIGSLQGEVKRLQAEQREADKIIESYERYCNRLERERDSDGQTIT